MAKIFYEHEQLIEKLEKRAGIKFTKTVRDLYFKFGYKKIKLLLIYMRQNNLKINNISIRYLFIGEKHLRHTLMPRVETFEIILKNHILHEITRIIGDRNIIAKPGEKTILVKASEIYLVKRINHSLRKSMKISNYDIRISKNSIFY